MDSGKSLGNAGNSKNKIKLNLYRGSLNGNIIKNPIIISADCTEVKLNFECLENSQYIPLV